MITVLAVNCAVLQTKASTQSNTKRSCPGRFFPTSPVLLFHALYVDRVDLRRQLTAPNDLPQLDEYDKAEEFRYLLVDAWLSLGDTPSSES